MRVAWCPQHRGVMRIAFFDPPQPHFYYPCPRCGNDLKNEIRNKYELNTPGGREIVPCDCCNHFRVREGDFLCAWCDDCPTGYCDLPNRNLK